MTVQHDPYEGRADALDVVLRDVAVFEAIDRMPHDYPHDCCTILRLGELAGLHVHGRDTAGLARASLGRLRRMGAVESEPCPDHRPDCRHPYMRFRAIRAAR